MVTVLGVWENGWLDPKTEAFMWRQLISAHNVDEFIMTPKLLLPERTNVRQYIDIEAALKRTIGKKVFVVPNGRHEREVDLKSYKHEKNACYIFGNAKENLLRFIKDEDDIITIKTHNATDMFAISVANTVLYERRQ